MENYFNYFTEIENYYQTKRESFTLLSTLDWVLIESWKEQGIPLEIVLKGMDRAFSRTKRPIGSLAYCVNAVAEVAREQKDLRSAEPAPPEFGADEVRRYLASLSGQIRGLADRLPEFSERIHALAASVEQVDAADLRDGENALNALEEKLIAILQIASGDDVLIQARAGVEQSLRPVRSKMTAEQLSMLERQLLKRKLMEHYGLPRLSLFYLI